MDQDHFKKGNEKKFKNKQRYKKYNNTNVSSLTKNETSVIKKSEDILPSNWSKYQIADSEEDYNEKANFEALMDAPVSQASYFKFKNEEHWSKNVEFHSQFQKYFTLDVNLLNAGVACVKFSERHGFTDEVLKSLDENTDKAKIKYEDYFNKLNILKESSVLDEADEKRRERRQDELSVPKQTIVPDDETCFDSDAKINNRDVPNVDDEDIDILVRTSEDHELKECIVEDPLMATIVKNKNINKTSNPTEDLEQWLDDILDD